MNADNILTPAELAQSAPAIFAEQAHASRGERYGFVPTSEVLATLALDGWQPSWVGIKNARTEKSKLYGSHTLRLRHVDASPIAALGGVMELVLRNAHDGTSAVHFDAGVFRFVCANGLVCGDNFGSFRVLHRSYAADAVREGIAGIVRELPQLIGTVETWRGIQLSQDEQVILAESVTRLRWPEVAPVEPRALLQARRNEDTSDDLWTTFNRLQENVMQGGIRGRNANNRRMRTRAVGSADASNRLNREMWALATRMAELKGTA